MIIGNAGSGKSTLARRLGAALDLPVYHMDREVYWLPGWVERDREDQRRQVERIAAKEAWVFEGNNSGTFHLREARADMVIWLRVPVWRRLFRVIRRSFRDRGRTRPDMAQGCPERLRMLPDFVRFIIRTRAASDRKQMAFFEASPLPKHQLSCIADTDRFMTMITTTKDTP